MISKELESISTPELVWQMTNGRNGNIKGSHLQRAGQEILAGLQGAGDLAFYRLLQKIAPRMTKQHKLNQFFGTHIGPKTDRTEGYGNPAIFIRNAFLERDGERIQSIRRLHGETIGEIQEALRYWTDSLEWLPVNGGQICHSEPLYQNLKKTFTLTNSSIGQQKGEQVDMLMRRYAEETIYHKNIVRFFEQQPSLVNKFCRSAEFQKLYPQFINAHIGAANESDEVVATAMLAGNYVLDFENNNPKFSPSQQYIPDTEAYHTALKGFITTHATKSEQPPLLTGNRSEDLTAVVNTIDKTPLSLDLQSLIADKSKREQLTTGYDDEIIDKLLDQFYRGKIDKELLKRLTAAIHTIPEDIKKSASKYRKIRGRFLEATLKDFVIDPEGRRNITQTVFGNILLGVAVTNEGAVSTPTRWSPNSDGYLGRDNNRQIPEIHVAEHVPATADIVTLVKHIFDGQPEVQKGGQFWSQTEKIYRSLPLILSYLKNNADVPVEVKEKITMITSPQLLAETAASRFGALSDQNINYINQFYREGGLNEAQQHTCLRAVFEFIEGVQSNIILNRPPNNPSLLSKAENELRKTGRIIGGIWVNEDYSNERDALIGYAVNQTLIDGENQILLYDNKLDPVTRAKVLQLPANRRMRFEKYLNNSYDTHFVIWEPQHNSNDNIIEIANGCWCPKKNTIFNPRTFHTW